MSQASVPADRGAFEMTPPDFDGRASALCLHGLMGAPDEMRPIAEALLARGIRCLAPGMTGRVDTAVELARVEVSRLRADSEKVFVAGLSTGGLVTLALAAENLADGVAVLGTPLRTSLAFRPGIPLASVRELMKLQKLVRRGLPKITAPVFVAHGALDPTANPLDAREIYAEVNTDARALHICKRSGEGLTVDRDGSEVASAIADFFGKQIPSR